MKKYADGLTQAEKDYDQFNNNIKKEQLMKGKQYATGSLMENDDGTGVHHFDHFIPAEKLAKFNQLAAGQKTAPSNKASMDMSNKGAQMMSKMGFKQGTTHSDSETC